MAVAVLAASAQYYTTYEAPNGVNFLPGPPSFTDSRFSQDIYMYYFGKQVQKYDSERAAQIYVDVPYGADGIRPFFSEILGGEISSSTYPHLNSLINYGVMTAAYGSKPKNTYLRRRPCVAFNEEPYSTETLRSLKTSYSYPSSHTLTGWGGGMLMAAAAPALQDTLLARMLRYSQSRVLGGMHWQSDVTDGRFISSACVARMLSTSLFKTHLSKAQVEATRLLQDSLGIEAPDYDAENYFDADHIANPVKYLPQPPAHDAAGVEFAYDMERYIWGKSIRETDRGIKARFDVNTDLDVLIGEFARAMGHPITAEYTPALYSLLQQAVVISDNACKKAQDHYARKRPFEFFKDDAYTFENQENLKNTGSYPSTHSSRTWTTALLLVAMNPEMQDTILKVGYDLGESAVIAGINWKSDVDAGRLAASGAFCRMLSNPNFMAQIQAAQTEYATKTQMIVTDQEDIGIDTDDESKSPMYTLDGRVATPESRGVIVGRNKKILK